MTNGIRSETNGITCGTNGSGLLECPCCGSAATVEPHLIEPGCTVGDQIWTDWWTASVNCTSCPLQFIAGGDTEEEAVRNAVEGWNRRVAVADRDCGECKERQGYYLDAETIRNQQERIKSLEIQLAAITDFATMTQKECDERDELIRDLLREAWVVRHDDPFYAGYRELWQRPTFEQRARELGIEVGE